MTQGETCHTIEQSFSRVTVKKFVENIPALRDRDVVTTPSNASLRHTLDLLKNGGYLSCPVRASDSGEWLGFIDMMDIMSWIISEFEETKTVNIPGKGEVHWRTWCQSKDHMKTKGKDLGEELTEHVINRSKCDPFCPVEDSANVYQLVETLARVHRVPIRDQHGQIRHIITQSAIIQFLNANKQVLGAIGGKTLGDLGLSESNVITMADTAEAIIAYHALMFQKVGGIAIVDHNGSYIGTLSASDLKGLSPSDFPLLQKSCREYLAGRHKGVIPEPETFALTDTLADTVQVLADKKVHRLWLLDPHRRPAGVVTLSSIMRLLLDAEA